MDYLSDICCICWSRQSELIQLQSEATHNLTYYEKLIQNFTEMDFEQLSNEFLVCRCCCSEINNVHNFRTKCLSSKSLLVDLFSYIETINNEAPELSTDIKDDSVRKKLESLLNTATEDQFDDMNDNIVKCIIADDDSKLLLESQEEYGDGVEYIKMEFIDDGNVEDEPHEGQPYFDNDIDDPGYQPDEDYIVIKEEEPTYPCTYCTKTFTNSQYLHKHLQKHSQTCPSCGKILLNRLDYQQHLKSHRNRTKHLKPTHRGHKCERCGRRFKTKKILQKHLQGHDPEPRFKCDECRKTFWQEASLRKHHRTHESSADIEIYQCKHCPKTFTKRAYLKVHLERHAGRNRFQCEVCFKVYSDRSNLYRHRLIHVSKQATFPCGICDRVFNRKEHLVRHENSHMGVKKFMCDICGKNFTTKHMVELHRLRHQEGPHRCPICPLRFPQAIDLETHLHEHEDEHPCHICSKRFKREEYLMEHIQRHNSGHYDFNCAICNKAFANKTNLMRHSLVHSKEKNFECTVCGKRLVSKYNLRMHMATHSEERSYECAVCKKVFTKQHYLVKHNEKPCT